MSFKVSIFGIRKNWGLLRSPTLPLLSSTANTMTIPTILQRVSQLPDNAIFVLKLASNPSPIWSVDNIFKSCLYKKEVFSKALESSSVDPRIFDIVKYNIIHLPITEQDLSSGNNLDITLVTKIISPLSRSIGFCTQNCYQIKMDLPKSSAQSYPPGTAIQLVTQTNRVSRLETLCQTLASYQRRLSLVTPDDDYEVLPGDTEHTVLSQPHTLKEGIQILLLNIVLSWPRNMMLDQLWNYFFKKEKVNLPTKAERQKWEVFHQTHSEKLDSSTFFDNVDLLAIHSFTPVTIRSAGGVEDLNSYATRPSRVVDYVVGQGYKLSVDYPGSGQPSRDIVVPSCFIKPTAGGFNSCRYVTGITLKRDV